MPKETEELTEGGCSRIIEFGARSKREAHFCQRTCPRMLEGGVCVPRPLTLNLEFHPVCLIAFLRRHQGRQENYLQTFEGLMCVEIRMVWSDGASTVR